MKLRLDKISSFLQRVLVIEHQLYAAEQVPPSRSTTNPKSTSTTTIVMQDVNEAQGDTVVYPVV
jgi:hypothetical protein